MQAGGGETNKYSSELLRKALVSPLGVSFWRGDRPKPQACRGQGVLSNVNLPHTFYSKKGNQIRKKVSIPNGFGVPRGK